MTVDESAPCKVNLTLDVFPPRGDGFHDLNSVVATFTPADDITIDVEPLDGGESTIKLFCSDPSLPTDGRNLAYRAAADFAATFLVSRPQAVTIRLDKRLPHQAGLGGGSSDAAAVLRALAQIFLVDSEMLAAVAAAIGSDVPLFLADSGCGAVRMWGRGDNIAALAGGLPPLHGILVKPEVGVPTGPAYALLDSLGDRPFVASTEKLLDLLATGSPTIDAVGASMHNDFEAAVLPAFPAVSDAHRAVTEAGAVRALLCGSGSAIFGLARDHAHARSIAQSLCGRFPFVKVAASTVKQGGSSDAR